MSSNSPFMETGIKIADISDRLVEVTKQLRALAEAEIEVSFDPSVLREGLMCLEKFEAAVLFEKEFGKYAAQWCSCGYQEAEVFLREASGAGREVREIGLIFGEVCSLLRDWKALGRDEKLDRLNEILASGHLLLRELEMAMYTIEEQAQNNAREELGSVAVGGVADAPDSYFGDCFAESSADGSGYFPSAPMPAPAPAPMPESAPMPAPPSSAKMESQARKVRPVRVDSVAFSVLSPQRVQAGEYSTVDVYMYTKSQRKIIEKAIRAAEKAVKETDKSGFSVSRGTEVSIILTSDDVKITDEVDSRTWDGECCTFDFQFFVPEDYSKKQIAFTCQVLFGGIQITRLHFTVGLSSGAARVPVRVKRKDCRKAFVSYSHKDEKRVLEQLSAIVEVAPKLVFWLDSQSMENGDIWRQEIRRAIRNADVFLLFWSVNARKSAEVEKEWRYAKKKKGIRFILPVPLDPPALCPPPEELGRHLHFNHRTLAHTKEMSGLTFASSKQFRRIK